MPNCHVLDLANIVIGLISGCPMMLLNISLAGPLRYMGFVLQLLHVPRVVWLSAIEEVLTAAYFDGYDPQAIWTYLRVHRVKADMMHAIT